MGEVDEDSGFLGIVRVLDFKVLEEIDGSPRIKALVEWRDSITIEQSKSPMDAKVVEVDKIVEAQNGVLGVGIENALVMKRPDEDIALAKSESRHGPWCCRGGLC